MDTAIVFTPGQILAFCSAVVILSGAGNVLANLLARLTAPNKLQDQRIAAIEKRLDNDIEKRLDTYDGYFARDFHRFEELESGNKLVQEAILALLSHAIDGNEVEGLKDAKKSLQKYLIEK